LHQAIFDAETLLRYAPAVNTLHQFLDKFHDRVCGEEEKGGSHKSKAIFNAKDLSIEVLTLLLYMRRILDAFDCTIALVEVELTLQSGLKATAYRPKEEVIQEEPHSLNPFDSHHAGRWAENMCSFTWDPCEDLVDGHKATPRHMPAEGAVRIETTPGPQSQSVYTIAMREFEGFGSAALYTSPRFKSLFDLHELLEEFNHRRRFRVTSMEQAVFHKPTHLGNLSARRDPRELSLRGPR